MKILTIVGARPQFIKAAALSRVISQEVHITEVLVHTGQHFDQNMSQIFFDEMDIPKPNYNLEINSLGHGAMTGKMLEGIEEIILKEKPDVVLVYGDTNSTLAGALATKKLNLPLAHVESGLRSFNMKMPEEINRILTDRISDVLYCPGEQALENLKNEGFTNFKAEVLNIGDIMYDTVLHYSKQIKEKAKLKLKNPDEPYVLLTLHRQENTDDPSNLSNLIKAINELAEEIKIVFPVHPRTKKKLEMSTEKLNAELLDPVGYFDMLKLIDGSEIVMTDSGGLQKEAFYMNKYCITLRSETEWIELVSNGFNEVCGSNKSLIKEAFKKFRNKTFDNTVEIYGKGDTADKIVDHLKKVYS